MYALRFVTYSDPELTDKLLPDVSLRDAMEQYSSKLRAFLRTRLPDVAELDDTLQDVFIALAKRLQAPEPLEDVAAWLFTVARRKVIDRYRKETPILVPLAEEAWDDDEELHLELNQFFVNTDDSPEAMYERAVVWETLQDALEELPADQREVFIRNELEGETFESIATEKGVALGTLLSRKRYAVQHLRRRLQTIYDEFTWNV